MSKITVRNVDLLLRGASTLACGGGLPYTDQLTQINKPFIAHALQQGIELLEPTMLDRNQYFVTVSEIGSADAPVMEKTKLAEALSLLEKQTGKKISGLIPGEIGQESITFEAASLLQLPVVNSDLSGCRAVPRLSDLSLVVQGIPFTMSPLVVLMPTGELKFIAKNDALAEDETAVRQLVPQAKVVTLLGGIVSGEMITRFLPYRSYSVAQKLAKAMDTDTLRPSAFPTTVLVDPLRCEIVLVEESESHGFLNKKISFISPLGKGTIEVENEYMALQIGKQKFAFPQLIMLIDLQKKRGLHSSEIQKGMNVTLVVGEAFSFWKGK